MKNLNRRQALLTFLTTLTSFAVGDRLMANESKNPKMMPALFIGHGSPMNAMADNEYTRALNKLGETIQKPKAILMISAHWETKGTFITGMEKPKTIHDFYGFPKELYSIQYNAPGSPEIANQIIEKLQKTKIQLDTHEWGLDHGTWAVLKHIFPQADIPTLQLSLDMSKPLSYHFDLGKELRFLREKGVMIMGSGNIVHNLSQINWDINSPPHKWTKDFDSWVKDKLESRDFLSLLDKALTLPEGKLSIPTIEHYLPLLYILGASHENDKLTFDYEGFQNASMSMRSLRFDS